jgi:formate dehydrogenase major subunit
MADSVEVAVMTDAIKFTLDGRDVEASPGETIWQVAKHQSTLIPRLCWLPQPIGAQAF